jgi:membrane-associated phospholipid phosphatase
LRVLRVLELRSTEAQSVSPARQRFLARPWWGLCIGAALIGIVVVVGALVPSGPLSMDSHWSAWMSDIETGSLHHLALVFNYLGRGLGRILSLVAIALVLVARRRWIALLAFAISESLTPLAVNLLKLFVDRPRPPDELVHVGGSSFPSGHAAYAGATAVALVLLFTRPGGRRAAWWAVAALAVAGMAWSRTYLQVHWLSDALAGAALGVGVALATFAAGQILTPPVPGSPAAARRRTRRPVPPS